MRLRAYEMAEVIISDCRGCMKDALYYLASPADIEGAKRQIHYAINRLTSLEDEIRNMDIAMETLQNKINSDKEVKDGKLAEKD